MLSFGDKEELIKMFLEARKKGDKAKTEFFDNLDLESKRTIILYQLNEVEALLTDAINKEIGEK